MRKLFFSIFFFFIQNTVISQVDCSDSIDICYMIDSSYDEFDNEIRYSSPTEINNEKMHMHFSKYVNISTKKTRYIMTLFSYSSSISVNGKGVEVIFRDGTRWSNKNQNIEVEYYNKYNYRYSASLFLNAEQLKLFKNKRIKAYRLYIYDLHPEEYYSCMFNKFIKCISNKKITLSPFSSYKSF